MYDPASLLIVTYRLFTPSQLGFVLIHDCSYDKSLLISIDPQMVGFLFQRMIRAGLIAKETEPSFFHLPNTHLFMLWGVDPVWSHEADHTHSVSTRQLLDFLYSTNIFAPLIPGVMLLPSLLPHTLPRSCDPESDSLIPRRTYFFSYLPSIFSAQLIARVVSKIQPTASRPLSPGQTTPTLTLPILTASGTRGAFFNLTNLTCTCTFQSLSVHVCKPLTVANWQ